MVEEAAEVVESLRTTTRSGIGLGRGVDSSMASTSGGLRILRARRSA